MLRTIIIGSISIQGQLVRKLANGMLLISDGDRLYTGRPANPLS